MFAVVAVGLSFVFVLGGLFGLDLYVNRKFQDSGGVNIWGYRGPTIGNKQAGERRVVVLGESTAFGYGVRWHEAFPALLEGLLNQSGDAGAVPTKVSVVNLAYNGEGAHSYRYTLEDYDYLDYDVAVFYTGYPDLPSLRNFDVSNRIVYRRQSALFRWTGYFPMLPLVMREKAMAIRYGGRLDDAYQGRPNVFRPNLTQRSTATALEAAADLAASFDRIMAEAKSQPGDGSLVLADPMAVECGVYTGYCDALALAVQYALERGKHVLVVTQPYISDVHREQQQLAGEYLRKRFVDATALTLVNLGRVVDLNDPALAIDGMHLNPAGNLKIAEALVDTVSATWGPRAADPTPAASSPTLMSGDGEDPPAEFVMSPGTPRPGTPRVSPVDDRQMVWIPAGSFRMGSPRSEAGREADEAAHRVTIGSGFWMDTHEVTNAAFQRFIKADPAWSFSRARADDTDGAYLHGWTSDDPPAGRQDHPVTGMPWLPAQAYCAWAGKRLPTEAEWEYAARAGTTTAYWWGDTFEATRVNADGTGPAAVGHSGRVNAWGLADMAGNVWEWTSSRYQPYPYRGDDGREDPAPGGDGRRVLRGGSWLMVPEYLRSADRFKYSPQIGSEYVGFRCVSSDREP